MEKSPATFAEEVRSEREKIAQEREERAQRFDAAEKLTEEMCKEDALRIMNSIAYRYGFVLQVDPSKIQDFDEIVKTALEESNGNMMDAVRFVRNVAGLDLRSAKTVVENYKASQNKSP